MTLTGMFFIDRKNKSKTLDSLNSVGKRIRQGKSILIFPEGTRSKSGELGNFKKGAFVLAAKSEVDVLPIKITGTGKIWGIKHGTLKSGNVTVEILKSLPTDTVKNLAIKTKQVIMSLK